MRCKTAARLISLKLDNELSASKNVALQEHLERCPSCRQVLASAQALQSELQELKTPAYPEYLHYRILSNLPRTSKPRWLHQPKLAYLAASLAIMLSLLAGTWVGIKGYEGSNVYAQNLEEDIYISFGNHSLMEVFDE